ncbi:MAG TPA: pyridoxamine 5'-phosphate oxidase family protein [Acidimicrobiia bacterium]|nr:pyridoxamine 5'-phosphate oxidase family protein [Acidimicrobiia bacterium]
MTDKTTIRRLPERGVHDRSAIDAILDEGLVCHAAYVIDGRPVVIPTLYARDGNRLLLHGSNSMGLARAVRSGSPLSVAVTHIDGLVVARSAFHSSANYRSVVVHGTGRLLEAEEKRQAFDMIVEALIPGRLADLRESTDSEISQTAIVELSLDEISAKVRAGGPLDEPEDMDSDVWAGVVPFTLQPGDPEASDDLKPGIATPEYLKPYRR